MSTELTMLAFSIGLGVLQLLAATQAATMQRGVKWNLSSREEKVRDLSGAAGRIDRAFNNFMQTFPLFVAAVLIVHMTSTNSDLSKLGAQIYFFARLIYFPVYALGITVVRSLIWLVSLVGLVMILFSIFLNG